MFVDTLLCKEVILVELLDMLEVFVDTVLERVAISVAAVAPAVSKAVIWSCASC